MREKFRQQLQLFATLVSVSAHAAGGVPSSPSDPGPYSPAAGQPGSTAVSRSDPAIVGWAVDYRDYLPGLELEAEWMHPQRAVGPASGMFDQVVSMGKAGSITMVFDPPIADGPGFDFAVFENGFSDGFLELGYVEVSSDGIHFERFPNHSLTPGPVGPYVPIMNPTHITGLAGKYRLGFGTPFDLADLPASGHLDPGQIRYVRIIDIIGDGRNLDSHGNPIYDPYPTFGSAGFDLDGIAVLNRAPPPFRITPVFPVLQSGQLVLTWQIHPIPGPEARVVLLGSEDWENWTEIEIEPLETNDDDGRREVQFRVNSLTNQTFRLQIQWSED